jgi:hypothetical protein
MTAYSDQKDRRESPILVNPTSKIFPIPFGRAIGNRSSQDPINGIAGKVSAVQAPKTFNKQNTGTAHE